MATTSDEGRVSRMDPAAMGVVAAIVAVVLLLALLVTGVLPTPGWLGDALRAPIFQGVVTIVLGVGGCFGYFYFSNLLLDNVIFPPRDYDEDAARRRRFFGLLALVGLPLLILAAFYLVPVAIRTFLTPADAAASAGLVSFIVALLVTGAVALLLWRFTDHYFPAEARNISDNIRSANEVRPWIFLFPAMFALGLYLCYPVVGSFVRSLYGRSGEEFVGLSNYVNMWQEGGGRAFWNNLGWVVIVPAASTFIGLVAAQLTDKLSWGNVAKSLIFMPMAISFVGASLIWKFVYANDFDIGIINAIRGALGADNAIDPLQIPIWNNFFLMVILIWIQTGFAMVILSAALRGIPEETVEAAIIDGANPFQVFFRIQVPQIMPTIVVVWTTITVLVLKVFDIVYTMTGGNFNTEILPSYMMDYMFRDDGRATAVAFVIMIVVLPVMWWNIRQARAEMR